jgi:hypothetical protein
MIIARMARLLTLVRVLWMFETFRDWLSVLPRARVPMRDFLLLALFVVVLYSEMGVYLFGLEGRMYGKCVVSADNPLANSSQVPTPNP